MDENFIKSITAKFANPDILGRDESFNTAVAIPLVKINESYNLLYEKRAAHIRQGSEICFPGGEFDKKIDEDYKETAIRETEEELKIDKERISYLGKLGTFVNVSNVIVEAYITELQINSLNQLHPDENEVEKIFTVPLSYLKENKPEIYEVKVQSSPFEINEHGERTIIFPTEGLNLPIRYHKPWGERKRKIYVYKYDNEVIWGITAFLTKEFIRKIENLV
jgi:8-oxo-dGTP pyrophosphatase MutT (NUDIX family)